MSGITTTDHHAVTADGVILALARYAGTVKHRVPVLMTHGLFSNRQVCAPLAPGRLPHGCSLDWTSSFGEYCDGVRQHLVCMSGFVIGPVIAAFFLVVGDVRARARGGSGGRGRTGHARRARGAVRRGVGLEGRALKGQPDREQRGGRGQDRGAGRLTRRGRGADGALAPRASNPSGETVATDGCLLPEDHPARVALTIGASWSRSVLSVPATTTIHSIDVCSRFAALPEDLSASRDDPVGRWRLVGGHCLR